MGMQVCPLQQQMQAGNKQHPVLSKANATGINIAAQLVALAVGTGVGRDTNAVSNSPVPDDGANFLNDIANLGLGMYTIYKLRKLGRPVKVSQGSVGPVRSDEDPGIPQEGEPAQMATTDDDQTGEGDQCEEIQNRRNAEQVDKDMTLVGQGIQTMIESQLYLAACFVQGAPTGSSQPENTSREMRSGFKNFIENLTSTEAKSHAREFHIKLDVLVNKYHSILKIVTHKENVPQYLKDEIKETKRRADELYAWARVHVSEKSKLTAMQNFPYIIAMAFAIRVEMDACIIESEMVACNEAQDYFIKKSRDLVKKFMKTVVGQITRLFSSASLLDVVFDLNPYMAAYITLIRAFRASMELVESPTAAYDHIYDWDDGLAPLRGVLYRTSDVSSRTDDCIMELENLGEMILWLGFAGADVFEVGKGDLQFRVNARQVCYALGAAENRINVSQFRLRTDKKAMLLQMNPAGTLRRNLWDKVKAALGPLRTEFGRPSLTLNNFARIRTIAEINSMDSRLCKQMNTSNGAVGPDNAQGVTLNTGPSFAGRLSLSSQGHTEAVRAVAVCAEGQRMVSGIDDGSLRIWSGRTGEQELSINTAHGAVLCVGMSPDGKRVVSGGKDNCARVWNTETGQCEATFHGHRDKILAVAMIPGGDFVASGSRDKTIKVWNATTGEKKMTLRGHRDSVFGLAVSPDGSKLVSCSGDKKIKVWNLKSGRLLQTMAGHTDVVQSVAVSPDGQRVVSGARDKTIKVWNLSTRTHELTLRGHGADVNAVAVLPCGKRVVSASDDKAIKVWNLETRHAELNLAGHCDYVNSLAICTRELRLVSGSGDGSLKVWH